MKHPVTSLPPVTVEIESKYIAMFIKKFEINSMNRSLCFINPYFQVKLSYSFDSVTAEKKWMASISFEGGRDCQVPQGEYLQAHQTIRQQIARIVCDQPLELPGIQPEIIRDHQELKRLAFKERVFFFITNLAKYIAEAGEEKIPISDSKSSLSAKNSALDTIAYLESAELLRKYIRSKPDSTIQAIHMAPFYTLYPEMKELLQSVKMRDYCEAFPHLLQMTIDPTNKGKLNIVFQI